MEKIKGFPSPFLPKKIKMSESYALECAKAIKRLYGGRSASSARFGFDKKSEFAVYRAYSDAEQDTTPYKTRLNHLRNNGKGKKNLSFATVDYSVLAVAPRFINNLVGKILDLSLEITVNPIDPVSKSERLQKKYEIITFMNMMKAFAGNKSIDFDNMNPIPEGVPLPENMENLDTYMALFLPNKLAEDFKDLIDVGFEANDVKQIQTDYVTNLVKVGSGCITTELDVYGRPKAMSVMPEDVLCEDSKWDDYRDITKFAHRQYVSISTLREIWPGQPEERYRAIANKASGNKYDDGDYSDFYSKHLSYPYDEDKVKILNCTWQAVDKTNYVVKYQGSRQKIYDKDENWLEGKDLEEYKARHTDREPIKKELQVWYGCKWIEDTDFVFDYGPKNNLMRESSNLSLVKPPFILRRVDPLMKYAKTIIDDIQINYLKFKQHVVNSRPNGLSIEMSAFENIALTKGGTALEPKEALALYFETGTILWRRKDWRGSGAQWKPIEEMKNGINDSAFQHFNLVMQLINLLRDIAALPQVVDSTMPDTRVGKGVTQIALGGVKETLTKLTNTYLWSYSELGKKFLDMTLDSITYYGGETYQNALGMDSVQFLNVVKDLNSREWALKIETGFTEEERAEINEMILKAQETEQISPEVAYTLKKTRNPYKAILLLKHNSEQNRKQRLEEQQAIAQTERDKNVESANQAADAEIRKEKAIHELQKELERFKVDLESGLEDQRAKNERLSKILEMEGEDKDRIIELFKAELSAKSANKKATA